MMFHVNMAQLFIALKIKGPGWLNGLPNNSYKPITNTSPSPIRCGFAPSFVSYKKGFTKTGCHDIAEILLKVALKHQKSIKESNLEIKNVHLFY